MAKFIEDRSYLKKKKKKETTTKKAAPSSPNKKQVANIANQVVNKTATTAKRTTGTVGTSVQRQQTVRRNVQRAVEENAPHRYNNRPSGAAQPSTNHTVQDRLAASRQRREQAEADIRRRRQENEARSRRISQSRNPRMQDTARGTKLPTLEERRQRQDRLREAQRQKMGYNSMASEEAQKTANRALKNTPTVVKESAKQVGIGHGKTLADITEANKSAAIGSKIDIKSKEFQEDIEKRRKESTRVAGSSFKTLSDMQEKSEQKMQKVTKDAKGLEKAYYGALESGTGMATDRLAGPAWAVSMLSRTYGNTRGQAKKEGATENEDRAYSLLQAAKEVATEYMFQGVGLAKGLSGSKSLSLGEKAANALTKNMRGPLANATHAGIRLLGGVGEENLEEVAGWGLDPFIKEFAYGKNVRTRKAQQMLREQSDALRSNITSMDDARAMAAYLSSEDFLEQQVRTYMDSGIGEKEARDLAENMRDYLDASLSGDTEKMADIEESMSKKLSGRNLIDIAKQDLSLSELKDTIESTTLLTATTGLPGTVTTAARGAAVKEQLGSDGIRALAKTAEDFEDGEMQLKAKAMSDRLDAGKDITNTQAYDLAVGVQEQYNKDADRQQTAYQTAQKTIKSEKLVTPYRVSRDGDIQMDEVTDKTYQSTAKSAKSSIETFIKNSDGKESLTDTEIDRGSRAIAGFKTGVFTVDDANELNYRNTAVRSAFEAETGVDLSEYVVKGKNGQIDIPATNTATKNALFAMAADNLVQTAQAETANWVDNTKGEVVSQISRRMGAQGLVDLQYVLNDVDERDRSSYMMTANMADLMYQQGRNLGVSWDAVKADAKRLAPGVAEEKLREMYEAGRFDRDRSSDKARGQQIKIGEKIERKKQSDVPTGQVIIETSATVKGSVIRTFTELARNLGVDIHLVDHFTDSNGKVLKNVNGEYIDGNIFINVKSDFEKNMGFIFMHEVTHHLKMYAPEQYKALENLVREKWFKYDSAQMQSEIAKKIETYAKHGQKLTEEQALEEIIADAAHEFLTDRNFAREIANEDASLAQAVLTSIRNALRMLRRIMSADGLDETHMNALFSQLDILDEAERLWLDAYKQAVRNNAAVEVDRLQNQIYEEGRMSVPDYSQEEMDAHRQALIDEISEYYSSPYTDNYAEAGFVFPDGQMLRMGMDGQRGEDHRIASHAYDDISDREDALNSFINEGNIRWMPELSTMEFGVSSEPTAEQYEWIRDVARNYSTMSGMLQGIREIDFTDKNGETVESKIVTNESADAIVNTIKRFYKTGTAEGGSQLSKFRYSIADMPSIDDLDMTNSTVEDENGDMVAEFQDNGSVRFSISSFEKSGREIYKEYLKKQVANHNLSKEEAFGKDGNGGMLGELETIYKISKEFADKTDENGDPIYAPFSAWSYADVVTDEKGKPVFSAIKKNSEYKMNIDFSTICKKRRTLDAVFREMINRGMFEKLDLNKDESAAMVVNINNLIRQHKFEAACALCFVEARRYRQQQTATTFRDMWNSIVESMYTGNNKAEYFNFGEDSTVEAVPNAIHTLDDSELDLTYVKKLANEKDDKGKLKQTAEAKAARLMLKDPSQRKLMRVGDMMASTGFENMQIKNPELMKVYNSKKGTGGAKSSFGDVQYLNEILKPRSFSRKSAYAVSGVRIQSFSDYVPRMVFDYVQVIADLAAKHLPAHGYTKEPLFVKQFGLTGAKINMSLVPDVAADSDIPGLDKDGNYIWNEEGTFPYDEAMAIQEAEGYKENCGTIAVGISDEHIKKMLADPTIQMVIPYHKSSLNPIVAAMTNVDRFENYEKVQTTKDENGNTVSKDFDWDNKLFRLSHDSKGKMLPKEQWGNVQDLVKEYADWCESKNYTPKFPQFLYMEDGSINPGYYKLLEDFALLDNDGNFKPQGDVQMRFPTEDSAFGSMKDLIAQGLSEDTELEAKRSSEISGIVDEIEGMFDQGTLTEQSATSEKLAARMSISEDLDEPYMAAVNAGNMEEAQKYVNEAAERAGYTTRAYHGTPSYGFTVFDSGFKNNGRAFGDGFYFTDIEEAAQPYAKERKRYNRETQEMESMGQPGVYSVFLNPSEDALDFDYENYTYNGRKVGPTGKVAMMQMDIEAQPDKDVIVRNINDGSDIKSTVYVIKDAGRIKSADTVTYAEDGSVIPLSQRFDPTNNDIRYSMSTEDADGNVLTTNQMEYFKNSQARDEQGRLIPMYHVTPMGGFTIFESVFSYDETSFSFSNSLDFALNYSSDDGNPDDWRTAAETRLGDTETEDDQLGHYMVYLNMENPLVVTDDMFDERSIYEWPAYAKSEGYDGVIHKDFDGEGGDIYQVFSSSQIKDTRNENPTENPDIRYSITEDEGKSKKDYEHATDMSYEELLMYEDMIANASESSDIESSFNKAFDGEKVSNFYSALTEEVGMVFDDEILEEGRMRMAKSKADFWSNLNTKWQERWETKGEVLDTKSVKTNVRNLIRGVMNNSDTDRQYKTELLNKTLMDMRVAYQLMKQDRTDIASALLYHSALRMISDVEFIRDDTEYQEYKGIRDYMRGEPITVDDDYWQGKAFQQFRKEHYGMLKLRKGTSSNINKVYGQLEELYPHIFNETEREKHGFGDSEEDLLQYIGFVTEQNLQPFTEAYSSEECAEWAFEIADDLYEIMENGEGVTSLADRYKEKYDAKAKAMKTRHAEAILRVRKQKQAAIDALKEQYNERLDQQKEHYNEKLDQQKERYNERLDRQKELAKDAIRKEREKFRQQKQDEKERTKERRLHSKYFDSIVKSHKTLSDRLLTNTKDKHIPEQYKKDLAELLAAFDLQTVASKKLEIRNGLYYRQNYQSQKTIRMKALQETLANIQADSQLFYVNDSITEIIDRLLGKNAEGKTDPLKSVEGRTIDELTSSELKDIDKLLKALIHEFNNYESVRTGAKRQQAADIGTAQIDSCLDHAGKFGEGLDYQNFLGALDNILNLDEVTPAYMFRQIDPQNNGIGMMFKELRRSFGKYVRNQNQLNEWMDEIIGEYNNKGRLWNKYGSALEEWRVSTRAKEFQLTNGNVKLTPAQMMSIYCLSHRQQAYDHMTGAGIVVQPVSFQARMASDLKKRANYALPVILTDADIKLITSKLTPDQIKVADKLQELMATKMAEWGNEASMSVMGIRLFEDPDYFPIKSDKAALEKDFSAEQFMDCIRNFGFTKAVQPGARNAIAIGDIFDVVAEHCNNMNLYNAYSESMNDFMKVYNYHAMREDGSDYSVEQAIAHAYSKKATTFIRSFMKDLNGNVSKERTTGIEQMMNDSLGKAKKASVFANGRVALQQPTALMRAFAVINPKYLKGVKAGKATMQEMFEHSPIALWKSWGYYDINMGKSIEDLMMNNGSWAEDKMSDLYGELDNRTWAVIWTMCKNEVEDKHKDVEKGSDEYWELVSERFDEVVDLTQVVDSPFHRSHAMRSKNTLTKMATAFMAEPTLTYNMVRDGFRRAKEEYRLGNKGKARKILGRTVSVFVLSAWATSAAAAIWDAVRGKAPGGDDDDDEQGFFDMWFDNMIENLQDNLLLLNNIYYIKDVVSIFQGWDQRNLGLQGWKHLSDGFRQLKGEKVYSKLSWYENWLAGIGYLTGVPLKTMMSDGKAIFKMFGLSAPGFITDQLDKLDSIGSSTMDMNRGSSSSSGISNPKTSSKSTAVNLWTYDNAPFRIEDGSAADNFLNHFGINLTSAEIAAAEEKKIKAERKKKVEDIKAKTAGMSGVEKDKKVWSYISSQIKKEHGDMPVSSIVEAGDYNSIYEYREMYVAAGGNTDYFDERIFDASKKAMKKSIVYNPTDAQIEAQDNIRNYLTDHGMSESELSEIAYKSYTAKELKVAFRLNDEDAIVEELTPLVRAGLSLEDFHRIYDNRNRIDLKKYKESGGKYAEKLKSMGNYNWPCNGTITSTFGHRSRSSTGGIGSTNHQGIDIGASMGAPVTAADGGVVVRSGWYGGYGKTVQIQHDDGTITQYSHLSWWEPKVGDVVAQGQEIGKVGSTGDSTGPHLHFGVMKNGEYVDPMDYLNKKS